MRSRRRRRRGNEEKREEDLTESHRRLVHCHVRKVRLHVFFPCTFLTTDTVKVIGVQLAGAFLPPIVTNTVMDGRMEGPHLWTSC